MTDAKERDAHSGVETTGHEWDGIRELNNPLPKWWLYILYACIVWSIGYWIVMPSWPIPGGYLKGVLGYTERGAVAEAIAEAKAAQADLRSAIESRSLDEIAGDAKLLQFAVAGGKAAFGDNCAPCHGSGAQGFAGYPNLNDDDWIWGGDLEAIHDTIAYGIRANHDETRSGNMPAFLTDEILDRAAIEDVAAYVVSLAGGEADADAAGRGKTVYAENCVDCHGPNGEGVREVGAPRLADAIWLYGSDRETVLETISRGRNGIMPQWAGRLDAVTVKQLAVYVHSLGGGE